MTLIQSNAVISISPLFSNEHQTNKSIFKKFLWNKFNKTIWKKLREENYPLIKAKHILLVLRARNFLLISNKKKLLGVDHRPTLLFHASHANPTIKLYRTCRRIVFLSANVATFPSTIWHFEEFISFSDHLLYFFCCYIGDDKSATFF